MDDLMTNTVVKYRAWPCLIARYGTERLGEAVLEQLLKMQLDQVLWLDKDSICARSHDFHYDEGTWHAKDIPSFKNDECPVYVSNLWQEDGLAAPERLPNSYVPRALRGAHGCFGVGGGGKTTINLTDPCLLACGLCFVPPSYLLLEDKRSKLGVDGAVMAVVLGKNEDRWRAIERSCSVIVWDEVSQWSMPACHQAIKRFPHHLHIFCGDPGCQLPYIPDPNDPQPPFTIAQFKALGYPVTRYDWSYRITNPSPVDPLRLLCISLRAMMEQDATTEALLEHVAKSIPPGHVLTAQDVVESRYQDIEETVLCSTNNHLREYNSALKERQWVGVKLSLNVTSTGVAASASSTRKRKFRALEGSRDPPNGTITISAEPPGPKCEERYASTVHDYQGRDTDKPIYIDTRYMFAREHPYTAVSRAKSIEQIYLVIGTPEPPSAKYQRTKIYRIASPHTDRVYIGHTTHPDLQRYFQGHINDRKRTSRHVVAKGDASIELIEAWPCATQIEAEAREQLKAQKEREHALQKAQSDEEKRNAEARKEEAHATAEEAQPLVRSSSDDAKSGVNTAQEKRKAVKEEERAKLKAQKEKERAAQKEANKLERERLNADAREAQKRLADSQRQVGVDAPADKAVPAEEQGREQEVTDGGVDERDAMKAAARVQRDAEKAAAKAQNDEQKANAKAQNAAERARAKEQTEQLKAAN